MTEKELYELLKPLNDTRFMLEIKAIAQSIKEIEEQKAWDEFLYGISIKDDKGNRIDPKTVWVDPPKCTYKILCPKCYNEIQSNWNYCPLCKKRLI
jgi:hypothetical protein